LRSVAVVSSLIGLLALLVHPASGANLTCAAGAERQVGTLTAAYAGVVKTSARAFREPGRMPFATFEKLNLNGFPTTFSIVGAVLTKGCEADWYRVQLPMRPNGVTGYVRAADIQVQKVTTRIRIDVSQRQLTFYDHGHKVLATPVAVGSPATPTPIGRFYVNQRILTTDPSGPFGPAALGVSAFSNVLTGWTQGGPIGIHGTNQVWSIGQPVSNGCIRVENAVIKRIFRRTPAGTPVVITP
jgi:lipoprotein-anchoring transpeptidase ErfK/SrfK